MIHDFQYSWSTRIIIGADCVKSIGRTVRDDGAHVVLLHYGRGDYLKDETLLPNLRASLQDAGLRIVELGGVVPNPRLSLVNRGIELAKAEKVDYIISVGGGSAVDSAKAISAGVCYGGDVWDLFAGKGRLAPDAELIPIAAVVTYPATGAEAGNSSVIRNDELVRKTFYWNDEIRPRFAYMDPRYTETLPRWLLVNGICDMMSHHTDRYMTDDAHFGVFDNLLEATMRYLHTELAPIVLDPEKDNLTDRTELMAVADMGVNEFIAWGRHKENASHQLAHPIGALYDLIHGSTLTIVYCSWLPYVYKDNPLRVARWAEKVWGVEHDGEHPESVAEEGMRRMKAWFVSLGMPTCFADAGIHPTDQEIDRMADMASTAFGSNCIGVMKKLYKEDIVQIYKNAL